jgi:hypothetical protein
MDKPNYPHKPIGSLPALANTLGLTVAKLVSISSDSDNSYTEFTINDGCRTVFEPKFELKKLQKRINRRIFEKVAFPQYLQGGLKCQSKRDYVVNASLHAKASTLISLDIKKFFNNFLEYY